MGPEFTRNAAITAIAVITLASIFAMSVERSFATPTSVGIQMSHSKYLDNVVSSPAKSKATYTLLTASITSSSEREQSNGCSSSLDTSISQSSSQSSSQSASISQSNEANGGDCSSSQGISQSSSNDDTDNPDQ